MNLRNSIFVALVALGCSDGADSEDDPTMSQNLPCSPVDDAFLQLDLTGGLSESIDWTAQDAGGGPLGCGSVGMGADLQLALAGVAGDGTDLSVQITLSDIQGGQTGTFDGELLIGNPAGLFSTADDGCTIDITTHDPIDSADQIGTAYEIEGTGTCDTLTDTFGMVEAEASGLSFRAIAVYVDF